MRQARATHQAALVPWLIQPLLAMLLDGLRAFGVGVPVYVFSRFTHPTSTFSTNANN
jgi:hypothetical protein